MSIGTLVNTVLIVAAIMPWVSATATFDRNSTVVRDMDGEPLKAGSQYYVLPLIRGRGGGLTLEARNDTCPLYVAQEQSEISRGFPVIFTPVSGNQSEIHVGVDLKVQTVVLTICVQSTAWSLDFSKDPQRVLVATGGTPSKFRIDQSRVDYVLAFCPVVCDTCRPSCGRLGIHIDADFNRWLATPSDFDFIVRFKKASDANSDSRSD